MARIRLHNEDWGFETNCFVCEPKNTRGLQVPFFHDDAAHTVIAEFELSNDFSGAPSFVHGGVTLALLDEAQAWACIAVGHRWAVTTETTTRFLGAVYVGKAYRIVAKIERADDATIATSAQVIDTKDRVRAESSATFAVLGEAQAVRAVGQATDVATRYTRDQ